MGGYAAEGRPGLDAVLLQALRKLEPFEGSFQAEHYRVTEGAYLFVRARAAGDLEQGASPGQPLSSKPRLMMERVMGQDLSDVRVHTAQLAPLGVQAATRGRDVYVEPGQDRFDTPGSLALLGHELTHISRGGFVQTKPIAQTAILSQARVQAQVEDEEAVAESNEQTIMGLFQESPTGPGTA